MSQLEELGGVEYEDVSDPDSTLKELRKQFTGVKMFHNPKEVIADTGADQGTGKGFSGNEVFTKDELAVIMDLEDEVSRTHQFERIHPRPSTCNFYYGFMEVKRYANALYCAWYSTPKKIRAKLLAKNQAYHNNTPYNGFDSD